MEKTHSKPLAARHGRGMLCVNRRLYLRCTDTERQDWQPLASTNGILNDAADDNTRAVKSIYAMFGVAGDELAVA